VNRDDNNTANPGRRRFLLWLSMLAGSLALFLAGIPVIGYVLAPLLGRQRTYWVAVGPVDQFSVGDTVHVAFQNPSAVSWAGVTGKTGAWLRRVGDKDFIAFVLNCSHLGCPVRWEPAAKLFMCPCHGGVYYEDGEVAAGPPPMPLQRFQVRVNNGQVELESRPIPIT
jgi:menaquinol-cytochrome c reductase iron-sulfur subunit